MRISDWSSDVCSSDLVLVDAAGDRLGAWMHVWRVLVPRTSAGPAVGGVDARLAGIGAPNVGRSRGWGRGCTFGGYWCPERRPVPRLGAWMHVWRAVVPPTSAGPAGGGMGRLEKRPFGKACVRQCRYWWAPYP